MTPEQRAETFESFKAKVNETDAARRDGGWALAMERGAVIAELVSALKFCARECDMIAAAYPAESATSAELLGISTHARNAIKRGEAA